MTISLIILTFNSSKFIAPLLAGITDRYKVEIQEKKLEVIIADNNSQDDTIREARKFSKSATIVDNKDNVGFARGNNLATKKAKGDVFIFLNPDTEIVEGDIFSFIDILQKPNIGIVGGKILSWDGNRELSCGKFYHAFNTILLALGLEERLGVRFAPDDSRMVDFVSGAFFAIRRDVFEKLKGFDEHYFMYIEDSDLCFRAKKMGYRTFFSPSATIQHMGQGSSNRAFAVINIYRGLLYFNKKTGSSFSYMTVRGALRLKALLLVMMGKIMNNKYLVETYTKALRI